MIKKYRKLPVEIEAIKLEKATVSIIKTWQFINNGIYGGDELPYIVNEAHDILNDNTVKGLEITTLEGGLLASWGDYIIKGVNGEFYPCKPDIFEKTYEEVGNA